MSSEVAAASPLELRVLPAQQVPFADIETVFGTRGDPAGCWCQWYKIPGSDWRESPAELAARLRTQIQTSDRGPGLVAYDGETPVGWCAVEPRPALPRLQRKRIVANGSDEPDFDDDSVWAVSCFVVRRAHRRRGVGAALAEAAVVYAREQGARVLEAYAVDPSARAKPPAADLFPGTVTMFERAGFVEVSRPTPSRAVMQVRFDRA
ncbi:GNAT superfamily N-acetyltransferase [Agromyces terreus]|uniref:GNAT superfamily N-acetyltransferase n=1 Tax=Agromyces terreus TaxID=424795 RepID=A0A9X2H2V1_9MICO|nr:GNAT family N-acetyltransferase [Agromyces terreus]MCP2371645.1 GNAT superfamily N-acetyltransferase [Agromyces terreus]